MHRALGERDGAWGLAHVQAGKDGWAGLGALAAIFPIRIADATGSVGQFGAVGT